MFPLNIGTALLQPLTLTPQQRAAIPRGQMQAYKLIAALGHIVEGTVSEDALSRMLGLRDARPWRSRVAHLVKRGALQVIPY